MKITLLSACVASSLCAIGPAFAQGVIDMSKVTCRQVLKASPDAVKSAIWIAGYYGGLHRNSKVSVADLTQNAELVIAACRSNPDHSLMRTINKLKSERTCNFCRRAGNG